MTMDTNYMKMLIGPDGCLLSAMADGEEAVFQVVGECMEPAVSHQASVRLERPNFFIPGDIIAFYSPNLQRLLMHRLLGYVRRRGAWKIMTMSDQGAKPDPLVDVSAVIGRVIAQGGWTYRISFVERLKAICLYGLWCLRYTARSVVLRRGQFN